MTTHTRLPLTLVLAATCGALAASQAASPQAAFDELLAADRAFSEQSQATDLVTGLSQMFADDVVMMAPGKAAEGKAAAVAALRGNPDNPKSRTQWMPRGGGISADGQHGFTFGFMLTVGPGDKPMPAKYLSYWVKGASGWRVAAFKRNRAAAADQPVSAALLPAILPAALVPPSTDAALIAKYSTSLADAEKAFSRDAQDIGLGAAFVRYGSPQAINLGGPDVPEFVVGNEAIGLAVGRGEPASGSSVSWGPDRVIVASSGDLGVSIGVIRRNAPAENGPSAFPFFTIWRRAGVTDPWRYIAE